MHVHFDISPSKYFTFHQSLKEIHLQFGQNSILQVGRFENGALNIIDTNLKQAYGSINSACDDMCYKCNYIEQEDGGAVFTDGDIILAGELDNTERLPITYMRPSLSRKLC